MPERPLLSYYNRIYEDAPTLTASTEETLYPASNAALLDHVHVWRTTDDDDEWIKFDFGEAVAIDFGGITRFHNLTSDAVLRIQGHTADNWADPDVNELITVTAGKAAFAMLDSASKQWWRVFIDDAANPDGYLEIPHVWLGEWQDIIAPTSRAKPLFSPGRGTVSTIRTRLSERSGPQLTGWNLAETAASAEELAIWQAAQTYAAVGPIIYAMDRGDLDDTTILCDWLEARIGGAGNNNGSAVYTLSNESGAGEFGPTLEECGAGVDQL